MPGVDVVLLSPAAIVLSLAGIQHGPHFDPLAIAILFGVAIGGAALILGLVGAAVGCVTAAFIRGASFGKSALIGIGVTTCAGFTGIVVTILLGSSFITYTTVIVAAIVVMVALVHRFGRKGI